jgi:hypothetical protein
MVLAPGEHSTPYARCWLMLPEAQPLAFNIEVVDVKSGK